VVEEVVYFDLVSPWVIRELGVDGVSYIGEPFFLELEDCDCGEHLRDGHDLVDGIRCGGDIILIIRYTFSLGYDNLSVLCHQNGTAELVYGGACVHVFIDLCCDVGIVILL